MNKVLKSKAEAYIKQARNVELSNVSALSALKNLYFLDHICTTPKPFSKFFKYSSKVGSVDQSLLDLTKEVEDALDGSVEKFLRQSSQLCSDMIKLCVWKGEIRNCCTFNMVPGTLLHRFTNDTRDDKKTVEAWAAWDQEEDWGFTHASSEQFKYPRRQLKAGKASGLSILLDPALDEYFCEQAYRYGVKNICSGCLPVCTEIEYQMDTSLSHIQSQQNIWIDDSNVSASWSDRNVSIVHIFFGQESTYARVRKELYGQTDLIGFSGLSLMEVIYFLTLRFWCRRRRKRHIVTEIASKFTGLWKKAREKRLGRLGARAKDVDYDKEKNERTTSKSIRKNEGFMNKAENGKRHQRELESNPNFATSPYFIIAQELKHIGSNLKRKDNSMQPPKYHNVFGDVAVFVPERNAI
ncbi:unnamed protein product [Orchesella dallaii]|uniref:Uncharacterized protein n=1 Tax=Orchesella dallaii TaxID=48710 RepID=A0ABP1QPU6_9HEXA